jgi:hypothetical protein
VTSFARLQGSNKFLQRFHFFLSLYIKMGTETDVTDFFIQLPYDTNVYSMLQKLVNTQLLSMNLCIFITF